MDQAELAIAEGQEADRVLCSPVFRKAFDQLKAQATARIVSSSVGDSEGREHAYFQLKALEALETQFRSIKNNGLIEADKIEKQVRRNRGVRKS